MKNSSKLLALGLVLFLGSCSALKEEYLDKVKGKSMYSASDTLQTSFLGTFDSKGKELQLGNILFEFVETEDGTAGTYEFKLEGTDSAITRVISTSDGISGTMQQTGGVGVAPGTPAQEVWFK